MKIYRNKIQGFSFAEIIIVCVIMAGAIIMLYNVVTPGIKATKKGNDLVNDLTNLNMVLDFLKKDIRICKRFGKNISIDNESYSFTIIRKINSSGLEQRNVHYSISKNVVWRTEMDFVSGKKIKSKVFSFSGELSLSMEKDPNIKNMIYISQLKLYLKKNKLTVFNLKTNAMTGLAKRVNIKSFYPAIEQFP